MFRRLYPQERTLSTSSSMNTVGFSPDRSLLASASRDQTVSLWNTSKDQELQEFEDFSDISAINGSIDDNTLITNRGAVSVDTELSVDMALYSSKVLVAYSIAIPIGLNSQILKVITFITEKREQNSSAGSCADREELPWISLSHFLSLSWFSSLCGKGVWKVAFFSTVVLYVSASPLDSDNNRTYYLLRVTAVVALSVARHQVPPPLNSSSERLRGLESRGSSQRMFQPRLLTICFYVSFCCFFAFSAFPLASLSNSSFM